MFEGNACVDTATRTDKDAGDVAQIARGAIFAVFQSTSAAAGPAGKQRLSMGIIVLEFNELCPTLLGRWMASGDLPNFKALHDASQVFVTSADAAPPALEPWIQWYSIHTGLSYSQHKVFHLTDGARAGHPDIWSIIQERGGRTGNFSSMNARRQVEPGCFFMADPWCTAQTAHPEQLQRFFEFVAQHVQEYANRDRPAGLSSAARLLASLTRQGLRFTTIGDIVTLLLREFMQPTRIWQRAVVLDWLQTDLFLALYRKFNPAFATFFLNSTAHFQHAYWRHMEPEAFDTRPSITEFENYEHAIKFGYQNMDRLVQKFTRGKADGDVLMLVTGLSQQPFVKYEAVGGQRFYRPRDITEVLRMLGLRATVVEPVMTHQYMVRFASAGERDDARSKLLDLVCEGRQVFEIEPCDSAALYLGCQLHRQLAVDTAMTSASGRIGSRAFFDVFYQIDGIKSGCHHPDGALWIATGTPQVHAEKVSILDIFPTWLEMLGIDYKPSAVHPFIGGSLVERWAGEPAGLTQTARNQRRQAIEAGARPSI
ncbi:MAG TPA: hypothetical protein VND95_03085 [Stellaceae bacterium]|nr:hypothetical protein [Stellaceae bacterium]